MKASWPDKTLLYNGTADGLFTANEPEFLIQPYFGQTNSAWERERIYGGTSAHWGGQSRPLDPIDFEERPGFPGGRSIALSSTLLCGGGRLLQTPWRRFHCRMLGEDPRGRSSPPHRFRYRNVPVHRPELPEFRHPDVRRNHDRRERGRCDPEREPARHRSCARQRRLLVRRQHGRPDAPAKGDAVHDQGRCLRAGMRRGRERPPAPALQCGERARPGRPLFHVPPAFSQRRRLHHQALSDGRPDQADERRYAFRRAAGALAR